MLCQECFISSHGHNEHIIPSQQILAPYHRCLISIWPSNSEALEPRVEYQGLSCGLEVMMVPVASKIDLLEEKW